MNKKYKTFLAIIIIFISIIILIAGSYFVYKYNKNKNQAEVIIVDELSINYMTGKDVVFNNAKKEIQFSIINDSEDSSMFSISLENIETESNEVTYSLYEKNKKVIKNKKLEKENTIDIYDYIEIAGNTTKSYKLEIENPEKSEIKFTINVIKSYNEKNNFSQMILNDNSINKESKTKIGNEIAIIDEGLIQDVDDLGNTFYFRGNVENNYVDFANRIWRIVRINGDGTVKLILNEVIDKSDVYDSNKSVSLDNLKNIKNNNYYEKLNYWYDTNLKEYDNYIVQGKFCVDTNYEFKNLNNYNRINVTNNPTFNCLGTNNSSKIGILTVDEIIYAGGVINTQNNNYYLHNPNITDSWWTSSPAKESVEGIYYYEVTMSGSITSTSTGESTKYLKPVINLNKDIQFTGKGTKEKPYVLK